MAEGITERGLDVKICGPESGEMSENTQNYFKSILSDNVIADKIGTLSYHSYWSDDDMLGRQSFSRWLKTNCYGYDISMSEWCELPCVSRTDSMEAALKWDA